MNFHVQINELNEYRIRLRAGPPRRKERKCLGARRNNSNSLWCFHDWRPDGAASRPLKCADRCAPSDGPGRPSASSPNSSNSPTSTGRADGSGSSGCDRNYPDVDGTWVAPITVTKHFIRSLANVIKRNKITRLNELNDNGLSDTDSLVTSLENNSTFIQLKSIVTRISSNSIPSLFNSFLNKEMK